MQSRKRSTWIFAFSNQKKAQKIETYKAEKRNERWDKGRASPPFFPLPTRVSLESSRKKSSVTGWYHHPLRHHTGQPAGFPASETDGGRAPGEVTLTSHPVREAPLLERKTSAEGRGQQSARSERGRSWVKDAASHPKALESVWKRCGAVRFAAAWKLVRSAGCGGASIKKEQEVGGFY
uniref:Uncharacterized protein n=1 Tax=Molossus molossus TaxID=27622 RepID=A0A7J8I0Y4_MOLMO|nr:hypothetical protein HJG59_010824 [Molossus molossus]